MADELQGRTIALLLAPEGSEQAEVEQPRDAVRQAGGTVEIVGVETGDAQAVNSDLQPGDTFTVDRAFGDVSVDDYDGVIVPGGTVGADKLRADAGAMSFLTGFFDQGKPAAVICHGPWTLIEAGVVEGRTVTSFPSLATDLRNAGAIWVDEEVVVDGNLITSRTPDDLPAFCAAIVDRFAGNA